MAQIYSEREQLCEEPDTLRPLGSEGMDSERASGSMNSVHLSPP